MEWDHYLKIISAVAGLGTLDGIPDRGDKKVILASWNVTLFIYFPPFRTIFIRGEKWLFRILNPTLRFSYKSHWREFYYLECIIPLQNDAYKFVFMQYYAKIVLWDICPRTIFFYQFSINK